MGLEFCLSGAILARAHIQVPKIFLMKSYPLFLCWSIRIVSSRRWRVSKLYFNTWWTYLSLMNWYNFPSINCCTIIRNVKGYMVRSKCNFRSNVIIRLILPLRHLKYKNITLKSILATLTRFRFTYSDTHLQVFGNHKVTVVVPVVFQEFICEVDLSTVLTRMLIVYLFPYYSNPRKIGSRKYSILLVKDKWPSIYNFIFVWKGFLGTASANKA